MSYTKRCCIRNISFAFILAIIIFFIRRKFSFMGFSDACAVSGICFLVLALFRYARSLHFYDLIIFGFHKISQIWKNENFTDEEYGSYADFLEGRKYEKNYGEAFAAAGCMFACSILIIII